MKAHMYKEVTNDNGYKSYYHASDNNATYILTSAYAHDMYSEFMDKYSRLPSSRWYRKHFDFVRVHE